MRLIHIAAATTVFACAGTLAFAADDDDRRQPIQELIRTEVVYPQERGELQITASPELTTGDGDRRFAVPLAVEYGLTDAWQVEFEWESFSRVRPAGGGSTAGAGGVGIGTKYSFLGIAGTPLHAAVGVEAEFPRGAVARETDETDPEVGPYLALALDVPRLGGFQVFGDLRVATALDADDSERATSWHAGALMPLRRITLATEVAVAPIESERMVDVIPSVILSLPGRWEAAVGVPIGVGRSSNRVGVAFNVLREM